MAKESERRMKQEIPTIFCVNHLGCGDHIVCNAIYRHFAETHNVVIPVKFHNVPSVQWMLRGLPVALMGVPDDEWGKNLAATCEKLGHRILRLGMFGKGFDEKRWDSVMYQQAGVPFEHRWKKWHVDRSSYELAPPATPYVFCHEDSERGFLIDRARLPKGIEILRATKLTENIFDWCSVIEEADELHLIDSCFAILADSLTTLKANRKVVHLYSRPGALPPTYKQDWEILR